MHFPFYSKKIGCNKEFISFQITSICFGFVFLKKKETKAVKEKLRNDRESNYANLTFEIAVVNACSKYTS